MDEKFIGLLMLDLDGLKKKMEEISGEWDGDNAGIKEERAHWAQEVIEKVEELKQLLNESI